MVTNKVANFKKKLNQIGKDHISCNIVITSQLMVFDLLMSVYIEKTGLNQSISRHKWIINTNCIKYINRSYEFIHITLPIYKDNKYSWLTSS